MNRIFWLALAIFLPKIVNDVLFSITNNGGAGTNLFGAIIPALAGGFVLLFCLKNAFPKFFQSKRTKCPECKENILKDAKICKHCGSRFEGQIANQKIENKIKKTGFQRLLLVEFILIL